jgi:hypothetical protein
LEGLLESNNILVSDFENVTLGPVDFIGRDIDIGFRIAKYAHRNKVTISPDVARLIFEDAGAQHYDAGKSVRMLDTAPLKGVWNERPFPIIWYYRDWSKILETFQYDEKDSEFYRLAQTALQSQDTEQNIIAIYSDLGLERHYNQLKKSIENPTLNLTTEVTSDLDLSG